MGDQIFHCYEDLMAHLQSIGIDVELGYLPDPIMLLEECQFSSGNKLEHLDDLKLTSLSNQLGMSVATSTAIHCGSIKFPSIFCGKSKAGISAFGKIKYETWRGKSIIRSGIAHQIESALPDVKTKYQTAIFMHYKRTVPAENSWRLISEECLSMSCNLILDLVN